MKGSSEKQKLWTTVINALTNVQVCEEKLEDLNRSIPSLRAQLKMFLKASLIISARSVLNFKKQFVQQNYAVSPNKKSSKDL